MHERLTELCRPIPSPLTPETVPHLSYSDQTDSRGTYSIQRPLDVEADTGNGSGGDNDENMSMNTQMEQEIEEISEGLGL